MDERLDRVVEYHEGTKHHVNRLARSLGYLDWASQPRPFRAYAGSRTLTLAPRPDAVGPEHPPSQTFDALGAPDGVAQPIDWPAIGYFLRYALGLSAWKALGPSRWSLRVNPSSGNLHPTGAYVLRDTGVWHYAPDVHACEERCRFPRTAWDSIGLDPSRAFLMGLTSIHWREAWKYGERAFRYCQHDIGHAIAALRIAAALCGWRAMLLPWPHSVLAPLLGVDRAGDFVEAEPEEPACVLLVTSRDEGEAPWSVPAASADAFAAAVRNGQWTGRASQLSEDHVQWTFIDQVAEATRDTGGAKSGTLRSSGGPARPRVSPASVDRGLDAGTLVLRRRSAVAFDGLTWLARDAFMRMLGRTMPDSPMPFDVMPWPARVHLVLFVHRVRDLAPGIYLLVRRAESEPNVRAAIAAGAAWERADGNLPLWRLRSGDCRQLAQRLSCDQSIAADGCFSLGMLAEFDGSLHASGASCYRQLFWETGVIGQVLYLEAEAAGMRGTGIGCFYDDAVHEVLGLRDRTLQSLYHFTVGGPVEDRRLTSQPGYSWEP